MKRRRRSTGTGSIYQPSYKGPDGEQRKSAFLWIAYRVGTKLVRERTKTIDRDEAAELLRKRLVERDRGRPAGTDKVTLADMVKMVLEDYAANGRSSGTRAKKSGAHLTDHFGAEQLAQEITVDHVTGYIAKRLEGGAAAATVNRDLAVLRRGFRLAVRAGRLDRRPDFSLLAEHNARKGFFEDHQLRAVLAKLEDDLRPPVEVADLTGWRIRSELLTRQWRHVDLKAGWLRLEPGESKNREGRMFPFTPELRRILEAQRDRTTNLEGEQGRVIPWVFHRGGEPIAGFHAEWREACKAAGLPGKYLHDLRRTAVRNMERRGVPRNSAMALVGHKTESMYRRYAIVDEAMLLEAAKKLAGGP